MNLGGGLRERSFPEEMVCEQKDFLARADLSLLQEVSFVQCNESYSRAGNIRGLHFQWNPYMAKLVMTIQGRKLDLLLDNRKGSPTFGYMIAHDMPSKQETELANGYGCRTV